MAFDLRHLNQQAIVADGVADERRAAEQGQHEAADAVDVLVLEIQIELLAELVDTHGSGHAEAPFAVPVHALVLRRALLDIADDLLEQILERDDARRPPCSSITTAICVRSFRIVASTASSGAVSGTSGSGRAWSGTIGSFVEQQPEQSLMWIMPTM